MSLKLAEVENGDAIRDHIKTVEELVGDTPWRQFMLAEFRGKYLLVGVDANFAMSVLAEIARPSPILSTHLSQVITPTMAGPPPTISYLEKDDLESLLDLLVKSYSYIHGAADIMHAVANRMDHTAEHILSLNEVVRLAKGEVDAVTERVTAEANARIEVANAEIAKLKAEKAELQSKLEETQRSKKKLREALERAKEAR